MEVDHIARHFPYLSYSTGRCRQERVVRIIIVRDQAQRSAIARNVLCKQVEYVLPVVYHFQKPVAHLLCDQGKRTESWERVDYMASVARIDKSMNTTGGGLETGGFATIGKTGNLHFYAHFKKRHNGNGGRAIVLKTPPKTHAVRIMWHTHPGTCYNTPAGTCSLPCFSAKDVGSFLKHAINSNVHAHVLFSKQAGVFVLYLLPEPRRHIGRVSDAMADHVSRTVRALEDSFEYPRQYHMYLHAMKRMISNVHIRTDSGVVRLFRLDHFPKLHRSPYVHARSSR